MLLEFVFFSHGTAEILNPPTVQRNIREENCRCEFIERPKR